jgi:effector-binding domain-containing protein/predicted small secreted protein
MRVLLNFSVFVVCCVLVACNQPSGQGSDEKSELLSDSLLRKQKNGYQGIFNVPEMLCMSRMDSGSIKDLPQKIADNFKILEQELITTDTEHDGAAGKISYNNDTNNFVFESLVLIKKIPVKQPVKTKIVVLEAAQMLIYDYYGPYEDLYQAYNTIRKIIELERCTQVGPMREFYLSQVVENSSDKHTRIMVPVGRN